MSYLPLLPVACGLMFIMGCLMKAASDHGLFDYFHRDTVIDVTPGAAWAPDANTIGIGCRSYPIEASHRPTLSSCDRDKRLQDGALYQAKRAALIAQHRLNKRIVDRPFRLEVARRRIFRTPVVRLVESAT